MNEKIETTNSTKTSEFSPGFIRALIIVACATILVVFGPESRQLYGPLMLKSVVVPPHILAGGMTVEYAIREFQGLRESDSVRQSKFYMLGSLLVDFVFVPLCFFFAWRNLFLQNSERPPTSQNKMRHRISILIFVLSGILFGYVCMINSISAFVSPAVFKTMKQDNTIDQNRSYVIRDLTNIDFKANQYFFLPGGLGGGDKSFRSHLDPTRKAWVTLGELGMPVETQFGSYSIKTVTNDTILVVRGKGKVRLSDGTYPEYEYRTTPTTSFPTKIN